MKKRAFTLTELLVVVVIVGVLSAVVLPKFTKILQTRKTTEAENVMAAVRNEQEARCMVGRNYTADTTKLASLPKANSKNYTYSLDKQGITATAKDGEYELKIPSYTDGRICCSGAGCDALNKDYPKCGSFTAEPSTCEAPEVTEIPDPEPEPKCTPGEKKPATCVCGVETGKVCNAQGTDWDDYNNGTCALTQAEKDNCSCQTRPGNEERPCEVGEGTQTRSYSCQNGQWVAGTWTGTCEQKQACEVPAQPVEHEYCADHYHVRTRTFNTETCEWGEWTGECPACEVPAETTETRGYSGCESLKQTRTFDVAKCEWSEWKCLDVSCPDLRWYGKSASDCVVTYSICRDLADYAYVRSSGQSGSSLCMSFSGNCGSTPSNIGNNGCSALGPVDSSVVSGATCGKKYIGSGQAVCRPAGTVVYKQEGTPPSSVLSGNGATVACRAYECR